jgi:hypothetical protein
MPEQQVCSVSLHCSSRRVTCSPETTLYSAAVASPAIAALACACGLEISENEQLHVIAGLHADLETLLALRELGMPLSTTVVRAAALSGRLYILQHLLSDQHCPRPDDLSCYAARSGSINILMWLKTERWCVFNSATCEGAAMAGQLLALQHLRSEGCEWDGQRILCYAASGGNIEVLDWLRQQQGIEINAEALSWAAAAGQTAMCK